MPARPVRPGTTVAAFAAADANGEMVSSTDLADGSPLVVYFYVKAKTPG